MFNSIVMAIDSGVVCRLVLLDLSSAFDTVDHDKRLNVLNNRFGIGHAALTWFSSYLVGCTLTFNYGAFESRTYTMDYSVPQRSVFSPKKSSHIQKSLLTSLMYSNFMLMIHSL